METRLQMVREIRRCLDVTYSPDYYDFLKCYMKPFAIILFHLTKPQFLGNTENKIRYVVIDILYRLPHTEVLRPFANDILRVVVHVLVSDNEEVGLQCTHIIFDIVRHYRPESNGELQPFFDFVVQMYQNFKQTVTKFFESEPVRNSDPEPEHSTVQNVSDFEPVRSNDREDEMNIDEIIHPMEGHHRKPNQEIKWSMMSFKMVHECPVVVMYLIQSNYQPVQGFIPHLVQLMIQTISVVGPRDVPASMMSDYVDLRAAQVKVSIYKG